MNTWDRINSIGFYPFYPRLVATALDRALDGQEPIALVCQIDAAFDRGTMFRHFTLIAATDDVLVHIHVDELDDGGAAVSTAIHPLARIGAVSAMEVFDDPEQGGVLTEVTLSVNLQGVRRADIEPAQCDDPQCQAEHGYSSTSVPDDLNIRVSAAADGANALAQVEALVDHLSKKVRTVRV